MQPAEVTFIGSLAAFTLGFLAGGAELVARYRDDPFRAAQTQPAAWYLFINGSGSLVAYAMIQAFDPAWLKGASPTQTEAMRILTAAFASIAFLRTSLFKIKAGGADLSIGPALLLEIMLGACDRAVDRLMAVRRSAIIQEIVDGTNFDALSTALPIYCMALMQNVRPEEQKEIGHQVNQLRLAPLPDAVKVAALSLALMNVIGDEVLREAVKNLKPSISWISPEALGRIMAGVDFESAREALTEYCLALARDVGDDKRAKLKAEVETVAATDFPNAVKAQLLGIALIDVVGEHMLENAIKALQADLRAPVQ